MDGGQNELAEGHATDQRELAEHKHMLARRRTPHSVHPRGVRLVVLICTLLVALAVLLASLPSSWRDLALVPFARPTVTVLPADVTSQRTATAEAAIWTMLEQRPLRLPALAPGSPCPVTPGRQIDPAFGPAAGTGPVFAVGIGPDGVLPYVDPARWAGGGTGTTWGGGSIYWAIREYRGPILVRGRQLDGPHAVQFNGGLDQRNNPGPNLAAAPPIPMLRLLIGAGNPWSTAISNARMQVPGCFGLQVDGQTFSETIVFQAVPIA